MVALLYFIALHHRHRDTNGNLRLGISAPWAAFFGVIAAFLVDAGLECRCCGPSLLGVPDRSSGFLGIIWIVLAAMFPTR